MSSMTFGFFMSSRTGGSVEREQSRGLNISFTEE